MLCKRFDPPWQETGCVYSQSRQSCIEAVVNVLRTSTQMGKHVREMEQKVADLFAKKHGIMLNSGSSANYMAIELLKLEKGDEVITPALTFERPSAACATQMSAQSVGRRR